MIIPLTPVAFEKLRRCQRTGHGAMLESRYYGMHHLVLPAVVLFSCHPWTTKRWVHRIAMDHRDIEMDNVVLVEPEEVVSLWLRKSSV